MSTNSNSSVEGVVRVEPGESRYGLDIIEHSVRSLDGVISIYETLRTNHLKRILLYSEIDGMIAGNPPYRREDLRSAGINAANFNTLEPRSLYERASQVYWNLLFTSESVININLRFPGQPDAKDIALKISRHWNDVIRENWRSFDVNVSILGSQLVKFGLSPIIWPDERDPRWRVAEVSKFLIPDQTSSDIDLLSQMFIETEVPIIYLINAYKEFKDDKENSPWDIEALRNFLLWISNTPLKDTITPNDYLEMERKLTSGDINYNRLYNESVRLVSYFFKENDQKISHYMFHRDFGSAVRKGGNEDSKGFLYKQESQYKCFDDCALIFTQSPGEPYIHGNRGLGHKMFSLCQAKMMLDNSMVDMGRWASTPIIKSPQITTKDMQQIRFIPGMPTNIGSAEIQQNGLGANLESIVSVSNHIGGMLQRNIAYSGDDPSLPDASVGSSSPLETKFNALREFGVLKNQVNHFYRTFDVLLKQMVIKMLKSKKDYPGYDLAAEWKRRCIADNVPEEIFKVEDTDEYSDLPSTWEVKATRSAGAGSQVAVLLGLQELMPMAATFGVREAAAFKREWVKATMGVEYVDEFTQDRDENDEAGSGASVAGIENAIMQAGKSPVFSPANDHKSHFSIHMALATQIVEQLNQKQFDIVEADSIFNVLIPHMREHWNFITASMFLRDYANQAKANWAQLEKYSALVRQNAIKQIQAQKKAQEEAAAQQQKVLTEEELKNMQVKNDEARKDFKVQSQVERAKEANETRAAIMDKKTDADIRNKSKKTDAEVEATKMKASLKNNAKAEVEADPAAALAEYSSGSTLSPYDIE